VVKKSVFEISTYEMQEILITFSAFALLQFTLTLSYFTLTSPSLAPTDWGWSCGAHWHPTAAS
jgi:hypothetical protein